LTNPHGSHSSAVLSTVGCHTLGQFFIFSVIFYYFIAITSGIESLSLFTYPPKFSTPLFINKRPAKCGAEYDVPEPIIYPPPKFVVLIPTPGWQCVTGGFP